MTAHAKTTIRNPPVNVRGKVYNAALTTVQLIYKPTIDKTEIFVNIHSYAYIHTYIHTYIHRHIYILHTYTYTHAYIQTAVIEASFHMVEWVLMFQILYRHSILQF